ncbi:AAA family ATPase [Persicitalea sp.]|uniref:AAA family ATPase n=1 Tax=Persicitalea sp. TaxID=3100273 RepID=UPI003593583B
MQRIEVKNFGPLKNITLDIKDYMVFIGPQASGKSTLAKLIDFFLNTGEILKTSIIANILVDRVIKKEKTAINLSKIFVNEIKEVFVESFPAYTYGNLRFIYSDKIHISINVENVIKNIEPYISFNDKFYKNLESFDEKISANVSDLNFDSTTERNPFNFLWNIVQKELIEDLYNQLFYTAKSVKINFIPSGRTVISLFSNSITFIENNNLDHYNTDFIQFANSLRKEMASPTYEKLFGLSGRIDSGAKLINAFSLANELSFKILKGDFCLSNTGDEIIHYEEEGRRVSVPLRHTSSGQQEASWLINTIHFLLLKSSESTDTLYTTIVEEPEAHLFPEAQRDMTSLITLLANQYNNRVIITTHSPYILAALNNLVEAHLVGQKEGKKAATSEVINPFLWINPENLYVGYLDNGGIENIIDTESHLIKHEILDGVSDDIMRKFDDLLEIQYDE